MVFLVPVSKAALANQRALSLKRLAEQQQRRPFVGGGSRRANHASSSSSSSSSSSNGPQRRPMATSAATVPNAELGIAGAQSPLRAVWEFYCRNLRERPLFTKAVMASAIFFVSDCGTQYLTQKRQQQKQQQEEGEGSEDATIVLDMPRALSGAGFGIVATTWLHYWWAFLEVFAGRTIPIAGSRLGNTLMKVFLDQSIGAPTYIYTYYVLTNFFQDLMSPGSNLSAAYNSWQRTNRKAQEMLWPTMLQHWKVWPAIHTFNFYFIPLNHRVLVQNVCLVGWSGYLSYLNNQEHNVLEEDLMAEADVVTGSSPVVMHTKKMHATEEAPGLMTPNEEIRGSIQRRETELRLKAQEKQRKEHLTG